LSKKQIDRKEKLKETRKIEEKKREGKERECRY